MAMRSFKTVNWSAVVRDAIETRIRLEANRVERDWDRVRQADRVAESIFEKMHRKY